jgi:hypothetical protein
MPIDKIKGIRPRSTENRVSGLDLNEVSLEALLLYGRGGQGANSSWSWKSLDSMHATVALHCIFAFMQKYHLQPFWTWSSTPKLFCIRACFFIYYLIFLPRNSTKFICLPRSISISQKFKPTFSLFFWNVSFSTVCVALMTILCRCAVKKPITNLCFFPV